MRIRVECTPYNHAVGGSRVMHLLAYYAHKLGHQVCVGPARVNPEWEPYTQEVPDPDLVILHEIQEPSFPGENVVRWVTYYPGGFGVGPTKFPRHEFVVAFHQDFLTSAKIAAPHQVTVPVFFIPSCDLPGLEDPLHPKDPRIEAVRWQGKGPNVPAPEFTLEITREVPATRRELVYLLKRTKRFYSCDRDTCLRHEAMICGCEVFEWDPRPQRWERWRPAVSAYEFMPWSLEEGKRHTAAFLAMCAKYFRMEVP